MNFLRCAREIIANCEMIFRFRRTMSWDFFTVLFLLLFNARTKQIHYLIAIAIARDRCQIGFVRSPSFILFENNIVLLFTSSMTSTKKSVFFCSYFREVTICVAAIAMVDFFCLLFFNVHLSRI